MNRYTREVLSLRGMIITSPERQRASLEELKRSVAKDLDEVKEFELKERQMSAKMAALAKFESVSPILPPPLLDFPPCCRSRCRGEGPGR